MFSDFIFDKVSNKITVSIQNLDISIINGIRRTLITDIPIVGFIGEEPEQSINIIENNTPLNNEIIKNRLSMIPIHLTDDENEHFGTENGINEFEIKLKKYTTELIENIYTKDFEVFINDSKVDTKTYFPINTLSNDHILITKLRKNENIELTAKAYKKTARLNASFNPIAGCAFYYKYEKISNNPIENERNYEKDKNDEPKTVIFSFEIINKLSHQYLFEKAINILIDKLHSLKNNIEDNTNIEVVKHKNICYDFIIENEDDTLGNIIQSYIFDTYVKTKKTLHNNKICLFVGYLNVHPLQNILKIRLSIDDTMDPREFKTFLGNICQEIIVLLNNTINEWNKFIQ